MSKNNLEYKPLAYCQMIDVSGSMKSALTSVIIDSKAFVQESLEKDEINTLEFSSSASYLYPKSSKMVKVSVSLTETYEAADAMNDLQASGQTNMYDAISLATNALSNASADIEKAYVLLSDGDWNTGGDPKTVIDKNIPLYVAALGASINFDKIAELCQINDLSNIYITPNPYEIGQMMNDIRSNFPDTQMVTNSLDSVERIGHVIRGFYISPDAHMFSLSVIWDNPDIELCNGFLNNNQIKLTLIDSDDNTTSIKPTITNDGYCIYDLNNIKPGLWNLLIEYSLASQVDITVGAFQIHSETKLHGNIPVITKLNSMVDLKFLVERDSMEVHDYDVNVMCSRPVVSEKDVIAKYNSEIEQLSLPDDDDISNSISQKMLMLREKKLLEEGIDILERNEVDVTNDYKKGIVATVPGAWWFTVKVKLKCPKTGMLHERMKRFCTLVVE